MRSRCVVFSVSRVRENLRIRHEIIILDPILFLSHFIVSLREAYCYQLPRALT